jgi:hypothetical protein
MYCNTLTLLQPHLISPRLKYSPLCPSAAQLRRYRDHMQYNTLAAQLTRDSSAPSLHLAISVSLLPVITALLASVQMSGLCAVCAVLPGTTAGRTHIHACLRQSLNNTSRHPLRKHYYYYRICHKTRHRYHECVLCLPDRLYGRPGFYRPAFPAKVADHCTRGTTPPGETWNLFLDQPRNIGYQGIFKAT